MSAVADELSESTLRQACADLDQRLRAGDPCRVEQVFAERPLLAAREDAALELIYTEFVAREDLGQRPTPEEYLARFPFWGSRLRRQFQVHRLFRDNLTSDGGGTASDPRETVLPKRLGNYELLQEVARGGGGGVIYQARQQGLDRLVAVKVLRPELGRKVLTRRRFFREAKVLAAVRHRHVVSIHDLGEHNGWIWYSMDLAEGGSVARLPLPLRPSRAVRLMESVAQTLQFVHELGIVHGDLKPSNLLLDADEHPLVSDFGLARVRDEDDEEDGHGFVGTPAYMAPEQFDPDGEVGPAADVWALGVILHELVAGRRPFIGSSLEELEREVAEADPAPLPGPDLLTWICGRCLAKDPAVRFTAGELAAALKGVI